MLLTLSPVAGGSFYRSWLGVLSTGCQHFTWLAVCRKWLKTGIYGNIIWESTYKSNLNRQKRVIRIITKSNFDHIQHPYLMSMVC